MTFSLLPDHLACRWPGTIQSFEDVFRARENAKSFEAIADTLRTDDCSLSSAVRWVKRRLKAIKAAFTALKTIRPGLLPESCSLDRLTEHLQTHDPMLKLRLLAVSHELPLRAPFGFIPPSVRAGGPKTQDQQAKGPDRPP